MAVVFDPPLGDEIDGLRRGLGDRRRARIAPHVTLVPPVNVAASELSEALRVLRRAAAASAPMSLTLGPAGTFAPATPVVYLEVGGDVDRLRRLRDAVAVPPLQRRDPRPWVPHVTVAGDLSPPRIDAAVELFGSFAAVDAVDRIVLLSESDRRPERPGAGRRWRPVADVVLGGVWVVAAGALAVELAEGRLVDPEVAAVVAAAVAAAGASGAAAAVVPSSAYRRLVVTARREGAVVGVAGAWVDDDGGHLGVLVAAEHRGQGIGSHLLAAVESAVLRHGWTCSSLDRRGPAAFYRARGG